MSRDKQIEEMAVMGCRRNPQAHTIVECVLCKFKNGMCDQYRLAEMLYNAGYRKVDSVTFMGGIVEQMRADLAEEIFAEIEDYMLGIQVNGFPALVINPDAFAELKKKYTEEGK